MGNLAVDPMSDAHGNSSDSHGHGPPPPPEPQTPLWLTAVGAVLFLTVALIWGLAPGADAAASSPASTAAATADAGAAH